MSLTDALDRYFAAWNDHDPDAVVRSLAGGGSYEDATTGKPLTGDALAANVAALLAGFPDLRFDLVSKAPTSDATAAAQWLMRAPTPARCRSVRPPGRRSPCRAPTSSTATPARPDRQEHVIDNRRLAAAPDSIR
jgi:hypothetical protein